MSKLSSSGGLSCISGNSTDTTASSKRSRAISFYLRANHAGHCRTMLLLPVTTAQLHRIQLAIDIGLDREPVHSAVRIV